MANIRGIIICIVLITLAACVSKTELVHEPKTFRMDDVNYNEAFTGNKKYSFNTTLSTSTDSRSGSSSYKLVSGYRNEQGEQVNPYPADLFVNGFDAIEHNQIPEDRIVKVAHSGYSELTPFFGADVTYKLQGGRYNCEWTAYCPEELNVVVEGGEHSIDLTNPELVLAWDPDPLIENVRIRIIWVGLKKGGFWTDDSGMVSVYVPDTGRLKLDTEFLKEVPVDAMHFRLTFKRYLPVVSECNSEKFRTVCYSDYHLKLWNFEK